MARPKNQMYRVELFIEVPEDISSPRYWEWDSILNPEGTLKKHNCPVEYVIATPIETGNA